VLGSGEASGVAVVSTLDDLDPEVRDRWTRFITDTLANSPALRDFIQKYRSWYPAELIQLIPSVTIGIYFLQVFC
jgi:hypothetical protein